ncbi:hypothetical protein SGRIM128S_07685 [Streptomyces griseomycini]
MPCRAAAVKSGRYAPTRASMPSVPRSICCTAATEVNSLVRDARSKGVSTVIGTRSAGGSSTAVSVSASYAAYRTAQPAASCTASTGPRPATTTAPAAQGRSPVVRAWTSRTSRRTSPGSSPARSGVP